MSDEYTLQVSRGYLRLVRQWVPTDEESEHLAYIERYERARHMGEPGRLASGYRGDKGQLRQSRSNMRRCLAGLPYEMLGQRPAMVTLTYPGEWRDWVPDGRVWESHRVAMAERWRRYCGRESLVGVWAKEFQGEGRPHLHMYLGLPDSVSEADYESLRRRTVGGRKNEGFYGKWEGRNRTAPIGGKWGGEFAEWLLSAWSSVVGTAGFGMDHERRGADVRVMFWDDASHAEANWARVAGYLAGESGKWTQKRPPEDFTRVGRYFGLYGRHLGFEPVVEDVPVDTEIARRIERRLDRYVRLRMRARGWQGHSSRYEWRRMGDGITALGLGPEDAGRLLRWATRPPGRQKFSASELQPR